MSRSCEFCLGEVHELARARNDVWIGCRRCQRSWREHLDTAAATGDESGLPMPAKVRFQKSTTGQYVTPAVAVALAFSLWLALKPLIGNTSPFLLSTPAVMVAAWYGVGPATLALGVSAVLGYHFLLATMGEPGLEPWNRVAMFLLVGGLV